MLGFSQREKDIANSDELFSELENNPVPAFDRETDNECIALASRFLAAEKCHSPQAPEISKQVIAAMARRDTPRAAAERLRHEILNKIAALNAPYIRAFHDKATLRANEISKLYKEKATGETTNILTDQISKTYVNNENKLDGIKARILADRDAVSAMQDKPLREILAKIAAHNEWYRSLDFEEFEPDETVVVKSALPQWARG